MQTYDIKEIKAKLEDIPSYEEKINYLEKTLIDLEKRYEFLQEKINEILDDCEAKQRDSSYKVLRNKLSCALKDAGIDIPIGEYNKVLIVYGKAEFRISMNLYYDISLYVNIRSRKYIENILSLLPDYELSGYDITKEVTKQTYIAEFVALVKKLLESKEIILKWNEMLR